MRNKSCQKFLCIWNILFYTDLRKLQKVIQLLSKRVLSFFFLIMNCVRTWWSWQVRNREEPIAVAARAASTTQDVNASIETGKEDFPSYGQNRDAVLLTGHTCYIYDYIITCTLYGLDDPCFKSEACGPVCTHVKWQIMPVLLRGEKQATLTLRLKQGGLVVCTQPATALPVCHSKVLPACWWDGSQTANR